MTRAELLTAPLTNADPDIERVVVASGRPVEDAEPLWRKFSDIQCATWIGVTPDALARFAAWIASGDDEDAWS